MNFKKLVAASMLTLLATSGVYATQPYGGCWHPDDIKNWSPETDPEAKFNRSKVPLATRFKEPTLMKANKNQFYEGQVCNATILFNMCSMCPSQGANNFIGYQPTYWQYMDKLVYWAGSASEGIIIPPPAGSIDAAHAQGVKVLGQIFFPPAAYGGTQTWVRQMVSKEDGKYIYAIKLYEIAKYLGFDGWFINEETGGASQAEWIAFIQEFNKIADENGDTHMEIQWYNASRTPNTAILASHKNTSQFLEYYAVGDYRSYASQIGCTQDEVFSKIYAGVQCVNSGLTGYNSSLNSAFPTTGHVGSLDLFCPEERAWKDNVSSLIGTVNDNGEKAYTATKKTFDNEEKVWVNQAADPSNITNTSWRGFSGAVLERSAIASIPFVSDMSVGIGKHRFVEGVKKGTQDWYHSGMQSILPTWRFWIENRGSIKVAIDWDDAFSGASSFKFTEIGSGDHMVRLYKTMIPLNVKANAIVVYKGGDAPNLFLSTASSTEADFSTSARKVTETNGWKVAEYDLSSLNGKTIYMVALNLEGAKGSTFQLGRFAMIPANYKPTATEISNAKIEASLGEEYGDIRISWDYDWSNDFDHFNIYTVEVSGKRTLVGQTRDEAFYIPRVDRNENDPSIDVEIDVVMKDGKETVAKTLTAMFPAPTAPIVTFKPSKSYVKINETVTLSARGTGKPSAWKWNLPAGLTLIDGALTDNTIKVRATALGRQTVILEATNAIGTSYNSVNIIDVLDNTAYAKITNIALKKTIVDYSGSTNATEVPEKMIDGVTKPTATNQKWCNVSPENWVIIDCGGIYRVYGFKIYDCKSGPENFENIRDYTIELSNDMKEWTTVVDEYNRDGDDIKEDYIVPTSGRYIRFTPKVAGTLRVWEFEAYGIDDMHMTMEVAPKEIRVQSGQTKNIKVNYNLNGDQRASDFSCQVTPMSNGVFTGAIAHYEENSFFNVPLTGGSSIGETDVRIRVVNDGAYKEEIVKVLVDCADQPNVLADLKAEVRHYKADYSYEAAFDRFDIAGLTDGDKTQEALLAIEDPSTHKDDVWAIFTAPEGETWNLAKVNIYLPDGNKSENDNGKAGFVNNTISIAVGDDLTSLTRVKIFDNLEEVSELEYIFPSPKETKYIAVICNLNPYFYPSLAEVEAYEQVDNSELEQTALEISNWDADVVAEATPVASHVTNAIDNQRWAFYSAAVDAEGAIANSQREIVTANNTLFTLAPFDGNNAKFLTKADALAPLKLVEPLECSEVRFLVVSTEGSSMLEYRLTYDDETTSEIFSANVPDWSAAASRAALTGFGRISKNDNSIDKSGTYCLYEFVVPADVEKKVASIDVANRSNGSYATILAVSAVKAPEIGGGVDSIENLIVNGSREIVGIYNIWGQRVVNPAAGVYVVRFADGTSAKVVVK